MTQRIGQRQLVLIGLIVCSLAVGTARAASPIWQTDAEAAFKTSKQEQRPLLLYVGMENCIFCRKMERTTFADEAVVKSLQTEFVTATVQAEKRADLVKWFKITSFPTTVIVSPDGKVIDYLPGYVAPDKMKQRLGMAVTRVASTKR